MKKIAVLAVALLSAGLFVPQVSHADLSASATAGVFVDVNANVGLVPVAPNVDAGAIQVGGFSTTVTFRVDANTEKVKFNAAASDLFKGDDPRNQTVAPIPLDTAAGVKFAIDKGNPVQGGDGVMPYAGSGTIGNYPSRTTGDIVFESSDNGHMSQNVYVKVAWIQPDPEKPMGEYSGKVKLTAMIVLPN